MTAPTIDYVQYTEKVVGANHPSLQDVTNRPLMQFLSALNMDPAQPITGMKGPYYNVKTLGAKGDGVTNDYNVIVYANTLAAITGGQVYFPGGRYKCWGPRITVPTNVTWIGDESYLVTIDCSGCTDATDTITASGSLTALPALGSNVTIGDRVIHFASAPSLVPGDVFLLYNSTDFSWSNARFYYRAGEFFKVTSIAGNDVTIENIAYDSYTSGATTSPYKLIPTVNTFRHLTFVFNTGVFGLRISNGKDCAFEDLIGSGTDEAQFSISMCYNTIFDNIKVDDYTPIIGENYGVMLGNSQRVIVRGSNLSTFRHGLTTGGGSFIGAVPCRQILIADSIISSKGNIQGADLHGNIEYCLWCNNQIPNGLVIGGDYAAVVGNMIGSTPNTVAATNDGVAIYGTEFNGGNFIVSSNAVQANGLTTTALVYFADFQDTTRGGHVKISNNKLNYRTYDELGIYVYNFANTGPIDITVNDNAHDAISNGTTRYGVYIRGYSVDASKGGFRSVTIDGEELKYASVRVEQTSSELISISNVKSSYAAKEGITILAQVSGYRAGLTEQLILLDNIKVYKPNFGGILAVGDGDGSKTIIKRHNNTAINTNQGGSSGSSITDSSLYAKTASLVISTHNLIGKNPSDAGSQLRSYGYSGIITLYENDDYDIGALASTYTSVTNRYIGEKSTISGYNQAAVVATQTNVELARADGRWVAVRQGYITGIVVKSSLARTAGTCTISIFKNTGLSGAVGAQIGTLTAILDGTNTSFKATTQTILTDTFNAGDEIYAVVTTTGTWTPITAAIKVSIEVEM